MDTANGIWLFNGLTDNFQILRMNKQKKSKAIVNKSSNVDKAKSKQQYESKNQ